MALRSRPFPADVWQDIKLMKFVPIESLTWGIGILVVGLVFTLMFSLNMLLGLIFSLIPSLAVFLISAFEIHTKVIRFLDYKIKATTVKKLEDLSSIKEMGAVSKTKNNEYRVFLQKRVEPWEVCPDMNKERRADDFANEIISAVSNGIDVCIFGTSSPENTFQLEERLKTVSELPPKIAALEKDRIDRHYKLSLAASSTQYIVRLSSRASEKVEEYADRFSETVMLAPLSAKYDSNSPIASKLLKVWSLQSNSCQFVNSLGSILNI